MSPTVAAWAFVLLLVLCISFPVHGNKVESLLRPKALDYCRLVQCQSSLQASAMLAHLSFLTNHGELQRCDLLSTKLSTSNVWANSFKITPLVTPGEHTGASPQGLCLQFVGII